MSLDLPPTYDDLTFLSPFSDQRAAGLCTVVAETIAFCKDRSV